MADTIADLLAGIIGPSILLGVTPELAAIERDMIALDWNAEMIAIAWPGDTPTRKAVCGDWKAMPFSDGSMGAAFGDGSLTMLDWPNDHCKVLEELARVIRPGGRVAIRCFAPDEDCESVSNVATAARSGSLSFHEFKLRFNIAVAAEAGLYNVPTETLFDRFEQCFPDRDALGEQSKWSLSTIAEIDAYALPGRNLCYPSREALAEMTVLHWPGSHRFVETSGYPGARQCPFLLLHRE